MASLTSKPRNSGAYSHYSVPCTRTHQIGALFLVVSTFFVTRLFDQCFSDSNSITPAVGIRHTSDYGGITNDNGILRWPDRGYGSHLSLKIYVYDENEIDGLKELLYGRDGSVKTASCLKGQWRSQGDRTDKKDTTAFNTWKDIIIPGNVEDAMTRNGQPDVQPLPVSKRKYIANYLGRAQGKAGRLKLIELSKQYPDKLECPDLKFSGTEKFGRTTYFEHLRNAKFYLAPRGESSWTLRFYESFVVKNMGEMITDAF